ncbi:mucin-19 isoform X3 [Bombus impatiens]|uniref:Mucin-19 isoform X3 n=1 Tax=Bombus impatiens TaxID=132113 RepID=A0A6P8LKG0_BOMIM|nr:mucin-19 isoform X3 [Bombus impatiens]
MRPILVILVFFSGSVLSKYYEKKRFDRSIYDDFEIPNVSKHLIKKQWTFTDYETHFSAYKDREENNCYIEKLEDNIAAEGFSENGIEQKQTSKVLYAPNEVLTKLEAWQIAGARIVDFCNGHKIILLQKTIPIFEQTIDPFFNILPLDENDIVTRRVADMLLTPLISRAKRQVALEERQKLNKNFKQNRLRRQVQPSPGKFRGQTQSQYLSIGNNEQKEGKAEAEATQQSSRAVVTGSNGMGQAQSMSLGSNGCEDCSKYTDENVPDRYVQIPAIKQPGDNTVRQSGMITPGMGTTYPSKIPASTVRDHMPYLSGGAMYPGRIPDTATGSDASYPTRVGGTIYPGNIPTTTIDGRVVHSGSVPGGTVPGTTTAGGVAYPGGVPSTITGGGAVHPGGLPGTVISRRIPYSEGPPRTTTGGGVAYPGGILTTTTGGGIAYPGNIPITTTGGGVAYPGSVSSTVIDGGTVYPGGVPSTTITGSTVYPGGVPSTTTGGDVAYPGGVPSTTITGGTVYPGGVPSTTTGGGVTYPGGVLGTTTSDAAVYPGGLPGTTTAGGIAHPGIISGTTTGGGITYPRGVPGTTTSDDVTYPGGIPGTVTGGSVPYPSGVYTSGTVPDTRDTLHGQIITDSKAIGDTNVYPSGQSPTQFFGTPGTPRTFPGRPADVTSVYGGGISPPASQLGETVHYPGNVIPGRKIDGDIIPGISVTAPSGGITYSTGTAPGTSNLDGTRDSFQGKYSENRAIIPPSYPLQGQYPGSSRWQDKGALTSSLVGHGQVIEQYPGEGQGIRQYPGSIQYPSNIRSITNTGEVPQYYQQPSNLLPVENDNSNSQASSSVKQTDSGTQASASAQGKFQQGTAQSQVTGTYSGSGSFSAQAGSTDINKSAQAEINGGKGGVVSNAQGVGGYGKSQTQVQLNSELGATTTGAQSSGWNHGTNSQVQASSKGGMADAQANGEGSTSSQAQIGFQPYLKTDEKIERYSKPFRGGGTASAQSGAYTGQSQSQLEGSFQYGITYTGAAQAGSGSGAATSRKPFNFNLTDSELFKPFKPSYGPQIVQKNSSERINTAPDNEYNQDKLQSGLQTSSSFQRRTFTKPDDNSRNITSKPDQSVEKSQLDDSVYDYEEEYNGEDYDMSSFQTSMNPKISKSYAAEQNNSNYQLQTLHVAAGNQYDVHVKQDTNAAQVGDVLQPGQSLQSRYTIPPGFRGRVISVAGDKIITHGDGKSQSQTVSLIPKEPNLTYENKSPISEIRSLKTNHERLIESHAASKEKQKNTFPQIRYQTSTEYPKYNSNVPMKPSYYTITNSIAGKLDGRNSPRKYEHRYYTKSSTCGYFTFSCNIVYGSNGRTKICKPKMPTYPDGTPMKC